MRSATKDQLDLIARMTQSHVITEGERKKIMAAIANGMTLKRASEAINWLMETVPKRKQAEKNAGQEEMAL